MSEEQPNKIVQTLRERGVRYVVGSGGEPVAVLLALDEYEHYIDLLDDEADSNDKALAFRLSYAGNQPKEEGRLSFREYLNQREISDGEVPG